MRCELLCHETGEFSAVYHHRLGAQIFFEGLDLLNQVLHCDDLTFLSTFVPTRSTRLLRYEEKQDFKLKWYSIDTRNWRRKSCFGICLRKTFWKVRSVRARRTVETARLARSSLLREVDVDSPAANLLPKDYQNQIENENAEPVP